MSISSFKCKSLLGSMRMPLKVQETKISSWEVWDASVG